MSAQSPNPSPQCQLTDPFLNATFTMPIPMGVVLRSSGSSPKLATTPVVDTAAGTVTWPLGNLRAGKKVKVAFKLVASNCTTPAELSLNGKFTYTDATGAKTVDACLKRPVRAPGNLCVGTPPIHRRRPLTHSLSHSLRFAQPLTHAQHSFTSGRRAARPSRSRDTPISATTSPSTSAAAVLVTYVALFVFVFFLKIGLALFVDGFGGWGRRSQHYSDGEGVGSIDSALSPSFLYSV